MPGDTSTLKSQQHLLKVHSSTYIFVDLIFSLEVPSRSSLLAKLSKCLMSTEREVFSFKVAIRYEIGNVSFTQPCIKQLVKRKYQNFTFSFHYDSSFIHLLMFSICSLTFPSLYKFSLKNEWIKKIEIRFLKIQLLEIHSLGKFLRVSGSYFLLQITYYS